MVRLFLLLIFTASNAWAILYPDINIEELIDQSDMVFSGTVASQTDGELNGKPFIQTTFNVIKWYGSNELQEVTIKQFAKVDAKGQRALFPGLPIFHVGQEYMVFLRTPSADGFSSPVGLLTFELFAKSIDQIVQGSSLVKAVPSRPVKGLFQNIQNQTIRGLVDDSGAKLQIKKNDPFGLQTLDQIIEEKM